jgi:hypothetical protein
VAIVFINRHALDMMEIRTRRFFASSKPEVLLFGVSFCSFPDYKERNRNYVGYVVDRDREKQRNRQTHCLEERQNRIDRLTGTDG